MNQLFAALAVVLFAAAPAFAAEKTGGGYATLLETFEAFEAARLPDAWNANFAEIEAPRAALGVYAKDAVRERLRGIDRINRSLDAIDPAGWPREQVSDFLAVRAAIDAEEFRLKVSRPWARDPGFYVDMLQRIAFEENLNDEKARAALARELDAVPEIVAAAQATLDDVARDYALLAIRNLEEADGVGHGHPRRASPPAGVIGWYDDLVARTKSDAPALAEKAEAARAAVAGFRDHLKANLAQYTAKAGVGRARYDWYLRQAKLLPYTGDDLLTLGAAEWDRTMAAYALAQHKDRAAPALTVSPDEAEYRRRIAATDANIRDFLVREEIITIPDYVGALDTNAPYMERPDGPNFWEAVQFRDPHPDHLHAVIPGHRFDGLVEEHNKHPIRGKISDGVRAEGWGVYLEEAMTIAGVLGERKHVEEMIHLFGVFRAARIPADVGMQRNEMSVAEAVDFMREKTPWLDENVARVDAEIYLRRPPGYGVGYTIGALQMRKLLAEMKNLKRDEFVLKDFHDDFMARGRLPFSLLRYEMTGKDDEIARFFKREPIPKE